ncbi:MAG TPA: type II secretion system F family protein [Opitutaceae bacterium]|nr:type II secretion system F family protein [Opitutaceae bacterium]
MTNFSYTARDSKGSEVQGSLDAATRRQALDQLKAMGLAPLRLNEAGASVVAPRESPGSRSPRRKAYSSKEALPFLRALGGLVTSGIQVGDGVRMLSRRLTDEKLKSLAVDLWNELSQGRSLSAAMAARPQVFDPASVHLIEAGEATGNLGTVIDRLIEDMEARKEVTSKLVAAMAYPVFIMGVAVIVILVFLLFLMPRIESLLTALRGKLPLATRLLISLADFLVTWGPVILVAVTLGGIAFWAWRKKPEGRMRSDAWLLKSAGIGRFIASQEILRITQTLSLLLENGITTIPALAMTERTLQNRVLRASFAEARAKIAEGAPISGALQAMGHFPALVIDVLTVGENTGDIVPSLKEIARVYRRQITRDVNIFLNVVSIGVLFVAFAFVALIAFGIILAVLQLSASLRVR